MCALIFTQYGRKIKKLRCDNEYASSDLSALVHKEGIVLEPCPAHEKNQNGAAERFNRTMMDMTRSTLQPTGLPDDFWGYAFLAANLIRNLVPTKGTEKNISPYSAA